MEQKRPWSERVTPELERFISQQTSFFLGTANAQGQPYIQHRGGPAGFLQVLTDTRLAFADLAGNRQYITLGNLSENQQAYLFLIDYQEARRIKLWGTARVVEDDEALLDQLKMAESKGRPERVILFDLIAWDVNCPQHIPRKMDTDKVSELLAERDVRIADLEARLARRDAR
ncbi:pyridoxamine 5'-phosphate oxidase family protein [Cohaesibacter marisflavi]